MKRGKKYSQSSEQVEKGKYYDLKEAIALIKKSAPAKFDETVEVALRLGVNPKHADQMVRGSVVLPHGTGRETRVLVIAQGEKVAEANEAGADYVGGAELVEKIKGGWLEFDAVVATPDMMREVGKLGKILGPRKMMPNPKVGTVTFDISRTVGELKAGRCEYRVDSYGIIHMGVGKVSFGEEKLEGNINTLLAAVSKAKPATAKGHYFRSLFLSSTMGPSVALDAHHVYTQL